jgi:glycosyltransferase involved in cell wall biosynthesis
MPRMSVVAPVFNELRETLNEFVRRVGAAVESITSDFEIILVDDGSRNDAWEVICALNSANPRVRGLRLARNFGQQIAITAGLDHAAGDWVVVMDSDLQDRPEVIPELYTKAQEGFDVVFVNRAQRPEPLLYRTLAALFYRILNVLSGQEYNRLHGNFSILSAAVARAVSTMREPTRFYSGMVRWVGFRHTSIVAKHGARFAGPTNYDLLMRARLGFDLIFGFSTRLLYFSIAIGVLMAVVSFLMGGYIIYFKLTHLNQPVPGWPSVLTAVFFAAGITNVALGLIGVYVGRIFEQTKQRPIYVLANTAGIQS